VGFTEVVTGVPNTVRTPVAVSRVKAESVDDPLLTTYTKSVGLVRVLPMLLPVVPETMTNETGVWPVETVGVVAKGENNTLRCRR
jgi:hypothetical protein